MTVDFTNARLRAGRRTILTIPSLRLGPGVHGLIGPNGAGKTTLLRHVFDPDAAPGVTASPASLSRAGGDAEFAGAKVRTHLDYAELGVPGIDREWASAQLEGIGLSPTSRLRGLSTGERQMLSAVVALAARTPVVMLDEPFNGLDAGRRDVLRDAIVDVLARRGDELTVLITSHRAEDLAGLVDDVTIVRDGGVAGPVALDDVRAGFPLLTGPADAVRALAGNRPVLAERSLAGMLEVRLGAPLAEDRDDAARASGAGAEGRTDRADGVRVTGPDDRELIDLLAMHGTPGGEAPAGDAAAPVNAPASPHATAPAADDDTEGK
ncbi:ATP-binding cassette domain-containing protein [Corynebacterium sp. 335C]